MQRQPDPSALGPAPPQAESLSVAAAVRASEAVKSDEAARFRRMLDSLPVLVSYVDAEHHYRFNNRTYQEWFELSPGEIEGRHVRDVLGEAAYELIKPRLEAASSGQREEFEARLPYARGPARHVHVSYVPDVEPGGRVAGYFALIQDISSQKQAEAASDILAESGRLLSLSLEYEKTLDNVAHAVVPRMADWCAIDLLNESGELKRVTVVHPDPEKVELLRELQRRRPPRLVEDRGLGRVLSTGEPDWAPMITRDLLDHLVADPELVRILTELKLRSYVIVPLKGRGKTLGALTLVYAESGRSYTAHDVAIAEELGRRAGASVDKARLIQTLQQNEERLRLAEANAREEADTLSILNQLGSTLSSKLDLHELVQAATDAATRLSGAQFGAFFYNLVDERGESYTLYTISGVPRERFEKFPMPRNTPIFHPTFSGQAIVRLDDVTQDPRYGQMGPHFGMPKGHLPVRSYLAVPVVSRGGEVLGGLFFGHEKTGVFTERAERIVAGVASQAAIGIDNARLYEAEARARAEAERVGRVKDEFLATLSHELRTPLNAILGWAQLINRDLVEPEDLSSGLETIERNARAQAQIVEDLLDMSRIISGKLNLDIGVVQPGEIVKAAIDSVRHAADAKEIRLTARVEPSAGPVRADVSRLQQIIWNLLSNAIKFTPRGGEVEVAVRRAASRIEVAVSDNGQGIAPEFLPHVFDRFRQAEPATTRRHGGLGLGLSIVKQLVELHGGTVTASSDGPGTGATFVVRLPLAPVRVPADAISAVPAEEGPHALPQLGSIKVLVVDDEPDARDLLRRILQRCGAEVALARSAKEALRLMPVFRPDILLSDIGMPETDGYALIRQVRALPPEQGGRTPAVALTALARPEDRRRALVAGFQVHIPKPLEPEELVAAIVSLVNVTARAE